MVKPSKLYGRLLESRAQIPFRDFQRILEAFGFTLERTNGSHRQYKHPRASRPLSIQPRGNMAKPYQVEQVLAIIEQHNLEA